MYDVVALGELLIDFTCQSTDPDGYPTMAAHPGGAPANYLAALTKYGVSTALLAKVGSDAFGAMLIDTLKKAGIETGGVVVDKEVFTTLAFVTLDDRGDRTFSFARKPGADTCLKEEELDLQLIQQAKVFHFGTLSLTHDPARTATQYAVCYAKQQGKLISFDPNLRKPLWADLEDAKRWMKWGLAQADVVKISDEEVEFLFGLDPLNGAEHILKEYGVALVFVTCGADGCLFKNAKGQGRVSALPGIEVKDTTGAGDIFGGSAMWKLLQIGTDPEALELEELYALAAFGCAGAGLSTTRFGGLCSVCDLEQVTAACAQIAKC